MSDEPISELFYEVVAYCAAKEGKTPIDIGIHHHKVDDKWEFALNASNQAVRFERDDIASTIDRWHATIFYCDFPVGIIMPFGGMLISFGDPGEAEAELINALKAAHHEDITNV